MAVPQDGFGVHVFLGTELYHYETSDATARLEAKGTGAFVPACSRP